VSAEEWWLICPACGNERRAIDVGYVRVGARSKGKRILGRCSTCQKLRWIRVERRPEAPDAPPGS
jgi:hypothetical protein